MITARTATWLLVTLLVLVHLGLWVGKGSVPHVWSQRSQLAALNAQNEQAQMRNQRMAAEVSCSATAFDFSKPPEERLLFPLVEPGDTPDFAAPSIRANIQHLHARLLGEEALRGRDQAFREFIAQDEGAIGEEWQRVAVVNTVNLKLLPEQLHALILEIDQVVARYIAAYRTTPSPGARPVQVQLNAFPLARARETLPDEPATEGSAE